MSFSCRFSLVLADEVTKVQEYYVICLFTFFKSLACLALQTETIVKKIMQPKLSKTKTKLPKYVMRRANVTENTYSVPGVFLLFPFLNEEKLAVLGFLYAINAFLFRKGSKF